LFGKQALQSRLVSRQISSQTKKNCQKNPASRQPAEKNYGLAAEKKSS